MKHELLVDTGKDFRAHGLLRPRENMAFQCGVVGVLQAHQFRRADAGKVNVEILKGSDLTKLFFLRVERPDISAFIFVAVRKEIKR